MESIASSKMSSKHRLTRSFRTLSALLYIVSDVGGIVILEGVWFGLVGFGLDEDPGDSGRWCSIIFASSKELWQSDLVPQSAWRQRMQT